MINDDLRKQLEWLAEHHNDEPSQTDPNDYTIRAVDFDFPALLARLRELEAVAEKARDAHADMFHQCLSNTVYNTWGQPVNLTKINEMGSAADAALAARKETR